MGASDVESKWRWTLEGPFDGLALARERRWLLVWNRRGLVQLLDSIGTVLAERTLPVEPMAADISDDGRVIALGSRAGKLYWFDRTLARRRIDNLPAPARVVTLDVDGSHAAVATSEGHLVVLTCYGETIGSAQAVRLIDRLVFADENPSLFALSEQGQLSGFDPDGTVQFSVHLAMRASDLAVDAAAQSLLVAAPALGLLRFDRRGEPLPSVPGISGPAELALSATGDRLLVATLEPELQLLTAAGEPLMREPLPSLPARVAMDPLARQAWVLLEDGKLTCTPLFTQTG